MVAKQLNDRQKKILAWINDGCPDNDWEPTYYKSSARMLAGHELVKIKGHSKTWRATITARGKRVLAGTETLVKPQKTRKTPVASLQPQPVPTKKSEPVSPPIPREALDRWADELHVLLNAAEFRIIEGLPINRDDLEVDWESAAKHLDWRLKETDEKWRLDYDTRHSGRNWYSEPRDLLDVCLYEVVPWQTTPVEDVVEAGSPRFHPAVKEVMKHSTNISTGMKPKARRLLHAVFMEAEARGWSPCALENRDLSATERRNRERHGISVMEYGFKVLGRPFHVSILELTDKVARPPTTRELKDHKDRLRWHPDRPIGRFYDYPYNGRLELHIGRLTSRDTKQGRRSVVAEIPANFAAVSLQALWWAFGDEMERRRKALWEKKLDLARLRAADVYRNRVLHEVLSDRAQEWVNFQKVTQYVADLEGRAAEGNLDESAMAWVAWCREHGQDHNPLGRLGMPEVSAQSSWDREKLVEEIAKTISDEEARGH